MYFAWPLYIYLYALLYNGVINILCGVLCLQWFDIFHNYIMLNLIDVSNIYIIMNRLLTWCFVNNVLQIILIKYTPRTQLRSRLDTWLRLDFNFKWLLILRSIIELNTLNYNCKLYKFYFNHNTNNRSFVCIYTVISL